MCIGNNNNNIASSSVKRGPVWLFIKLVHQCRVVDPGESSISTPFADYDHGIILLIEFLSCVHELLLRHS